MNIALIYRFAIATGLWMAFCIQATWLYAADPLPTRELGRLLVMPCIDMTAIHGEDASVRGPLSRQAFVTDTVAPEADLTLSRLIRQHLAKQKGFSWEPALPTAVAPIPASAEAYLKILSDQGHSRGADHILASYLYAYRLREGGDYGVQTPAKVIFELNLVQSETRRVVWQQRFDETQQALSDNLLNLGKFIQRKGRWIRAREMAEQAVQQMLDTMLMTYPSKGKGQ